MKDLIPRHSEYCRPLAMPIHWSQCLGSTINQLYANIRVSFVSLITLCVHRKLSAFEHEDPLWYAAYFLFCKLLARDHCDCSLTSHVHRPWQILQIQYWRYCAHAAMSLYSTYSIRKQSQCSSLCYLINSARKEGTLHWYCHLQKSKALDKNKIKNVLTRCTLTHPHL